MDFLAPGWASTDGVVMFNMLPDPEYTAEAPWQDKAQAMKSSVDVLLDSIEDAFRSCPESESGLVLEMRHTARKLHNIASRVNARSASGEGV